MKKILSVILSAAMLLTILVFASGCETVRKVDLAKYVTYTGYSGFASLNKTPEIKDYETEYEDLKEKRSEARDDDDDDDYEEYKEKLNQLKDLKRALELVEFEVVKGDDGELENGDEIKVKADYNEKKLEKYNIEFDSDEFEVTVKDLEEKEVVDPFAEDVCVFEYSGVDGNGYCDISSYKTDDYSIYYSVSPSYELSNGDTITVTATLYSSDYVLKGSKDGETAEKEFKVDGLGEVPQSLEGVDTAYIDKEFLKEVKSEKVELKKGLSDTGYTFGIHGDNYRYSEVKIMGVGKLKAEKKLYGVKESTDGNEMVYAVVYSQTAKIKMIDPSYSSKLKKGAVKTVKVYYTAHKADGLMVLDNKLKFINEDYHYISTFKGFDSLSDAVEDLKDDNSSYTMKAVK